MATPRKANPKKGDKKTEAVEAKRTGREPMPFDQDVADFICEQIADGNSLRKVIREYQAAKNLPGITTIFKWLDQHESFAKQYARACDERAESFGEEINDIADEAKDKDAAGVQAAKLRIETRKWLMGKVKPKKYGDRVQVDNTHSFEQESTDDLLARATKYAAKLGISMQNGSKPADG